MTPRAQDQQAQLRALVKKLWGGALPLGAHGWKGQQIENCFIAQECLSWLEQELHVSVPVARDTMKELQKMGYLELAVSPEPSDNPNAILYRLSMPSGAIPGQPTTPLRASSPNPGVGQSGGSGITAFAKNLLKRDPCVSS